MTDVLLTDELGPRGRRRVLIGSIVAGVLILGLVAVGVKRFSDNGQFAEDKWRPLTQWSVIKFYLGGLGNTLKAAGAAMVFAMVVGGLMALARLARTAPIRWVATLYVEFFRGMALYLLILFFWLGLPRLGVSFDVYWYLVLGLGVYNSSILAEVFRAGILSLDRGQSDAAAALGLRYWQSMGMVIIPQAVRRMLPAIISQLVTLLKDTSLGVLIFYEEILRRARLSAEFFQNPVMSITLVALFYIAINATLSKFAVRLESRQRQRYKAGSIKVTGMEQLAVVGAQADAKLT